MGVPERAGGSLDGIAVVVPARAEREIGVPLPEPLTRASPAPAESGGRRNAVDALLEPEVVDLEPGGRGASRDAPSPGPGNLVEIRVPGEPDERGAVGLVTKAGRVGALVVPV